MDMREDERRPTVPLIGEDGNAFNILGLVKKALRRSGYSKEEIERYQKEATAGDYNNLLSVTQDWVDIE